MNKEEILKAIDAIIEHYPAHWRRIGNEMYIVVDNPDYGHISSEENSSLLIDFEILRKIVSENTVS